MTVKDLKENLSSYPDEMNVLVAMKIGEATAVTDIKFIFIAPIKISADSDEQVKCMTLYGKIQQEDDNK